jgi:pyrroline-5-carboxylate reductase
MKTKAAVFLGGGRITGALAAGLRLAELGHKKDRRTIVVYDRHPEKLRALRRESRVEIARDLKSAVVWPKAEMLIVAVRPRAVKEILGEIAACGAAPPKLCISLAAGIPLRKLRAWLSLTKSGSPVGWVRAMPSPVSRMGKGLTALSFDRGIGKKQRAAVRELFEHVGDVIVLPEKQMDAFTATFSSTHGYHALAALARAAQKAGLDRKTALATAAHALADGIEYWRGSGLSLDELLAEAATPGGIAAATMAAMDKSGYGRAVADGIRAGVLQARRNAK